MQHYSFEKKYLSIAFLISDKEKKYERMNGIGYKNGQHKASLTKLYI